MKTPKMAPEAVEALRALSGFEKEALCWHIGSKKSWIYNLLACGRAPGPDKAIRIEEATHGKVKREWIRPDIDWKLVGDYDPRKVGETKQKNR
nr:MAG TPA: Putative antitoxin of bacterial toxin-antitoxin system, YdaS/YdaT [Caudoviricetes sp.]